MGRIILVFVLGSSSILVVAWAYLIGLRVGRRQSWTAKLQATGLNRHTLRQYREAVRILYRLDGTHDVSGVMAGDALSPETREQVTSWVADHRKAINRS